MTEGTPMTASLRGVHHLWQRCLLLFSSLVALGRSWMSHGCRMMPETCGDITASWLMSGNANFYITSDHYGRREINSHIQATSTMLPSIPCASQ